MLYSNSSLRVCVGDMILWDSRTIHCSTPALDTSHAHIHPPNKLLRVASYISMTPYHLASESVISNRVKAYEYDHTTTHWPHIIPEIKVPANAIPVRSMDTASPEIKSLIGVR